MRGVPGPFGMMPIETELPGVVARAGREGHPFTVALVRPGVTGQRRRPPSDPGSGDLAGLAAALSVELRPAQVLYGADRARLAVVVPGRSEGEVGRLMRRAAEGGAPALSWAAARWPADGRAPEALLATAARRLEGADPAHPPCEEVPRSAVHLLRGAVAAASAAALAVAAVLLALAGPAPAPAPPAPPPGSVPALTLVATTTTAVSAPAPGARPGGPPGTDGGG